MGTLSTLSILSILRIMLMITLIAIVVVIVIAIAKSGSGTVLMLTTIAVSKMSPTLMTRALRMQPQRRTKRSRYAIVDNWII
jgi:hypothetical protein